MCRIILSVAVICVALPAWAQDVASGPTKGEKTPALKVFDATGPHKDKEVDFTADRGDKPTVYVFIAADKWTRPMARFLKRLDAGVKEDDANAYIVAVWLSDKPDDSKAYLPRAQQSLGLETTALTVYPGEKSGPNGWGINTDAHVTVAVANKAKVAGAFGYRSINDTDVPAVRDALRKAKE
jgi:hypothetical protein